MSYFSLKLELCFNCIIPPTHRRNSIYYLTDPKELLYKHRLNIFELDGKLETKTFIRTSEACLFCVRIKPFSLHFLTDMYLIYF